MSETTEVVTRAERLASEASDIALAMTIDSADMLRHIAADELKAITARRKQIDELRLSLTRPLDDSKARIMTLFRAPTERLLEAEEALKRGMLTYHKTEQRRIADEARRQAENEERERVASLHAAQKAAQEAGDEEAAENAHEEIEAASVAPRALATQMPKAHGISTRENWKSEITDFAALVIAAGRAAEVGDMTMLAYLIPDTTAINRIARALKAQTRIPGVRVYNDAVIAVRGATGRGLNSVTLDNISPPFAEYRAAQPATRGDAMTPLVTIKQFALHSGYSAKAVRRKIERGDWLEGVVWIKAPDGRILIDTKEFLRWARKQQSGAAYSSEATEEPRYPISLPGRFRRNLFWLEPTSQELSRTSPTCAAASWMKSRAGFSTTEFTSPIPNARHVSSHAQRRRWRRSRRN